MSTQISVMEAIQIAAQSMKDYADGNALFYGQKQYLTSEQKKQAKENLGVYTSQTEPTEAQEGDIWMSEEDEFGEGARVHVINLDSYNDLYDIDWGQYSPGSVILVAMP